MRDGRWKAKTLRQVLGAPRTAGLRYHNGTLYSATWEPILDRETHEHLKILLTLPGQVLPGKRRRSGDPVKFSYLLTGVLFCALCGQRMWSHPKSPGRRAYMCLKEKGGCGGTGRKAEPLEDFVRDAVFSALETPAFVHAMRGKWSEREQEAGQALLGTLCADEQKLTGLEDDFYDGLLDRAGYLRQRDRLISRIETSRNELARMAGRHALASLPPDLPATWEQADLAWRRRLIRAVVEKVWVYRVSCFGSNTFDPTSISIRWRL